jgi:agmatinase
MCRRGSGFPLWHDAVMARVPTFALPPSFLAIERRDISATFCIAGVPFDIGTTNRSGCRFGPAAIRQASRMLVDGDHPYWWVDPTKVSVADIGDFQIALGDIPKSLALIEEQAGKIDHLISLGGDHSVSLPLLRAAVNKCNRPLALIHFDAHVDTWPDNFGQRYAHGSVFFHAIEEGLIDPKRTVQIGIRSPVQKQVYDWTKSQGVTVVTAQDVHELGPAAVAERVAAVVSGTPAYLSIDIDVLDPAFAPGTGTPEIGGLASWQMQATLRRLPRIKFAGMDVVEVAPPYDVAEITALAAATIVWEYLALTWTASKNVVRD